ncbi:hypothetical protein DFS34DRAFT_614165 [Phlyctochytrium arcticum]|nr:hypothetical protein DFS34DRAFT_614165 [Phlyctochytrium arcticum]
MAPAPLKSCVASCFFAISLLLFISRVSSSMFSFNAPSSFVPKGSSAFSEITSWERYNGSLMETPTVLSSRYKGNS